ncbi:alanyl-tRNA editing protein [Siminovitchia fortis]|uniref:alanyl-tRNA editing protein n=1 Tax=Siminovitchia fortis TaxID=254758 RepID=UPI0011A844A9|nr:alanyl-tRNA editing protein [Siminovitchia fortis]
MTTTERFLNDSYKSTLEAKILKIEDNKVWLDETIFYPKGGGQESDIGWMIQSNNKVNVAKVRRENGEIVHYISNNPSSLHEGPVQIEIDLEHRFTQMRYHTLLHLIAAVLYNEHGYLCTGNQIQVNKARIDFSGISEWDKEKTEDLLNKVKKEIQFGHPVTQSVISRAEAESREGVIKTMISLIPEHINDIRVISIGEIDDQACGGTHVQNTKEVGDFEIVNVKNKGKNIKRFEVQLK